MMNAADATPGLALSEEWWGFRGTSDRVEQHRDAVMVELGRELVAGHPLFERVARVEAFWSPSDDVLVRLVDDVLAIVHPTWTGRPEILGYPLFVHLGAGAEATARLKEWEQWY